MSNFIKVGFLVNTGGLSFLPTEKKKKNDGTKEKKHVNKMEKNIFCLLCFVLNSKENNIHLFHFSFNKTKVKKRAKRQKRYNDGHLESNI